MPGAGAQQQLSTPAYEQGKYQQPLIRSDQPVLRIFVAEKALYSFEQLFSKDFNIMKFAIYYVTTSLIHSMQL